MNESFSKSNDSKQRGKNESLRAAALAGAFLFSHGDASAFEIKPGSDFDTGIRQVYQETLHLDHESQGILAVDQNVDGTLLRTWGKSDPLSWKNGGFGLSSEHMSSLLHGTIAEVGPPFTVYYAHSHYAGIQVEGTDPSKRAYSVPPSAGDVVAMLMRAREEVPHHGSRSFSVRYVVADSAGVWFFDKMPNDANQRSPLVISYALEENYSTPLHKWIEANAIEGEKDPEEIKNHVKPLMSGELYKSLIKAYQDVGVSVRYTLWSDISESDFPLARDSEER